MSSLDGYSTRLATSSDQQSVIDLWRESGLTRPWNDPEQDFEFAVNGPTSTIIILEQDAQLVGAAMVGHDGHRGAVYYVGVRSDTRRRGAGRFLMDAVESWLKDQGVWKINLLVRQENKTVVSFYEALGYSDQNCVALGKRLDAKTDRQLQ